MQNYPLLNKLERKFGRFAIKHFMLIIVIITAAIWLLDTMVYYETGNSFCVYLYFNRTLILKGEVWRVVSFLFVPTEWNLAWFAITMYFYCLIGSALEEEWGAFRFGLFYFCGYVFVVAAGFITGSADNTFLHMTLFLAFAILNPNYEILLFFFIPVKVKYLAILDGILLGISFISGDWLTRILLIMSLLNLLLFFWRDLFWKASSWRRSWKYKRQRRKEENEYVFPEEREEREKREETKENKRKEKKEKQKREEESDFPFEL